MSFDISAARRAGYSDDEIAEFLSQETGFDLGGARGAGYSSSEIVDGLAAEIGKKRPLPAEVAPSEAAAGRGGAGFAAQDPRRTDVKPEPGIIDTMTDSLRRGVPGLIQSVSGTQFRANAGVISNLDAIEKKIAAGQKNFTMEEDPYGAATMTPEQRQALRKQAGGLATRQAGEIVAAEATRAQYPAPQVVDRVMKAGTFGEALAAFSQDPVNFVAAIGPESLVQSGPGLAMAALVPGGAAVRSAAMGAGSSATEYGSQIIDGLREAGVNLNDPDAIRAAANDAELMASISQKAFAKAAPVGALDAASGGLVSKAMVPAKVVKNETARKVANVAAQVPVQGAMGGAGELAGQIATGDEIKPGAILAEIAGESFGAPGEVAAIGAGAVRKATSFTEPDSPSAQAGLTPIVVPVPDAPTVVPEGQDVGLADAPGTVARGGGDGGGAVDAGGVAAAGRDPGQPGAAGAVPAAPSAPVRPNEPVRAGAGEQPQALTNPAARTPDSELLARAERESAKQEVKSLDEQIKQARKQLDGATGALRKASVQATQALELGDQDTIDYAQQNQRTAEGRLRAAESQLNQLVAAREQALGRQMGAQAPTTGETSGDVAAAGGSLDQGAGPVAGSAAAGDDAGRVADGVQRTASAEPATAGGAAPQRSAADPGVAQDLKLIQDARLKRGEATKLEVVESGAGGLAAAVARAFKAPIYVIRDKAKKARFNGVTLNGRVYVNADGDSPAIAVVAHEVGHTLPEDIKGKMISGVMETVTPEQRAEFLDQFPNYQSLAAEKQDEELVMRIIEQDAQKPEFWQRLADKVGEGDFGRIARAVVQTIDKLVAAFTKEDANEFTTDLKRVREIVTDALAEGQRRLSAVDQGAQGAATSQQNDLAQPTDGQKKAGNYKVGRVKVAGLDISIENPEGSVRSGRDPGGNEWRTEMRDHYGYIRGTVGRDKDHIDVFIKPGTEPDFDGNVYVVDQRDPATGEFDEHKVVIGASSEQEARDIYQRNYSRGWQGLGSITEMTMDGFKDWLDSGDTVMPADPAFSEGRRRKREQVGEFEVVPEKDGSLTVLGDADEIRGLMPDDITGRVVGDGVRFTNSDAPRVRAALEGRKVAYSRAGQVTEKMPMKDGKYLGAPPGFDTPAKIPKLRRQLRQLADEGAPGRYWYENSSKEVLRMAGGNVQEARKFVALLAIYSPQAKVDANTTFALRAWAQYKAGHPISVKTGSQDGKATAAMRDVDAFWSGEKTGNFFFNLLREIDPSTEGKQGATIDMWMMRAGQYQNDAPTKTQYAFMENETNRLAQELGWEPQQVQAAIWVAMKARMENDGVKKRTEAISEKKGWIRFDRKVGDDGKIKKVRVILDAQKHRDNWLAQAMAHDPTKTDTQAAKFDFSDGLLRHIGQVSFEARPGRTSGALPGIHDAPYAQQVEFQQAVQAAFLNDRGVDELATQLGLLVDNDILAPGVWQGEVSPSTQLGVAMAPAKGDAGKSHVDPAQRKALNTYAAVAGLVARQEGVGWHRPFYSTRLRDANGVDIDIGRPLNPTETADVEKLIGQWMAANGKPADWNMQLAMIATPKGVRLVNFGVVDNETLRDEVVAAVAPALPDHEATPFASDGDMPTNNWETNRNGQDYLERIAAEGRSDVLDWARAVLAPRVQRVFEDFSKRYGWGDPGKLDFSEQRDRGAVDAGGSSAALPGAPRIDGATGPDPRLVQVAEDYARQAGIDYRRQGEYVDVDEGRARRIAAAYEAMPHRPRDPFVREAYKDLIRQTRAQYDALAKAGYRFYFFDETNDPYQGNPWNAMRDLRANQVMAVFATESGFGSSDLDVSDNPLLEDTGLTWPSGSLDGKPKRVLANDLFRAVHDAFGHGLEGAGFRARGEENAWQAHSRLFKGPAVGALTSETRGQNSWLNFGPFGEKNRTARVEDTTFADQKTGLMPSWTWEEGRAPDFSEQRDVTKTPEFKRWFGNSKVVDAEGKPLVVYHGTEAARVAENMGAEEEGVGIDRFYGQSYFTANPREAESYALSGQQIYPVYLSIKRPYETTDYDEFAEAYAGLADDLEKRGFDGVIYRAPGEAPQFLAFRPEQIKSALGNRGTFDPSNPRIDFSEQRSPEGISNVKRRAFHGTPFRGIDKFSTDKIGTGEGAQAYGWGLYFAGRREIAEFYRKGISYRDIVREFRDQMPDDADFDEALEAADSMSPEKARVVRALAADDWLGFDYPAQAITAAFKNLDNYDASEELRAAVNAAQGQLYEVEIPGDEMMLDYDAPLKDQPPAVKAALEKLGWKSLSYIVKDQSGKELYSYASLDAARAAMRKANIAGKIESTERNGPTGGRIYELMSKDLGGDMQASLTLREAGIPGLRYLDAGSRGTQAKTKERNYVVFSGDDVEVAGTFYSEQRVKDRPGFREWFGESKVVDADGSPKILFTGTSKDVDFKTFKAPKNGIWFTSDPKIASDYANENDSQAIKYEGGRYISVNTAARVLPVYLKLENPKVYEKWPDSIRLAKNYRKAHGELWERLRAEGHDGVIGPFDTFVAFRPDQVKSIFNAEFDGDDPRFSEQREPTVSIGGRSIPVRLGKYEQRSKDNYSLVMVRTDGFDQAFQRDTGFYVGPQGKDGIEGRYERFKEFASFAPSIEASVVSVTKSGVVRFGNGRHRYAVMRDEGNQLIPVAMSEEDRALAEKAGIIASAEPQFSNQRRPRGSALYSAQMQQGLGFPVPNESRTDRFRRTVQDYFLRVKRVQEAVLQGGGLIGEQRDVYAAEERMYGRVQAQLDDFANNWVRPMIDKAAKAGIDLDELALYAYAKHAPERNAYIDTINPALKGRGSGMTDADAASIIAAVPAGKLQQFEDLRQDLLAIAETTRQRLLQEGLISQDEYDAWTSTYQDYVPLRGFDVVNDETGAVRPSAGRGFNIRGKESLKAMGRASRAGDIIENVIRDYERAVMRIERNAVGKVFLDLVSSNPDPNLWEINSVAPKRSQNRLTGLVSLSMETNKGPDTVSVKLGGKEVYITVHDELLLRAMRKASQDETGQAQRILAQSLGRYNTWMRNTLTRYNPVFALVNSFRDAQTGAVNSLDKLGAGGAALYAKYYRAAMAASARNEMGSLGKQGRFFGDPAMDRYMDEFKSAGGTTGGWFLRDVADIETDLRQIMVAAGAAPRNVGERITGSKAWQGAKAALKYVELFGAASENASRLAAYRAARELGKTPAEAASIAKNLTTNFNRKGEWGTGLNALYLFFNAAMQGTARTLEALKNPKVLALMGGVTATSAAIALANAEWGGDDDDGQSYWDKIPDYEKERNFIIMLPPAVQMSGVERVGKMGQYIKIPMPYGFNIFPVLGYQMADLGRYAVDANRGVGPGKAAIRMVSAVAGSYNPLGGNFDPTDPLQVGMAVAPTAVDVGVQLAAGVDAFGRPIGPRGFGAATADAERFTPSQAGTPSQKIARWLNENTGGTQARSGGIDVMPGTIDNAVRIATGGVGTFLQGVFVNMPSKLADPEAQVRARDIVFLRNVFGQVDENVDRGLYYDRVNKVLNESRAALKEMKLGIDVKYDERSRGLQVLGGAAQSYTELMSSLRKEELRIVDDPDLTADQKKAARRDVESRRNEFVRQFNELYLETMADVNAGLFKD